MRAPNPAAWFESVLSISAVVPALIHEPFERVNLLLSGPKRQVTHGRFTLILVQRPDDRSSQCSVTYRTVNIGATVGEIC